VAAVPLLLVITPVLVERLVSWVTATLLPLRSSVPPLTTKVLIAVAPKAPVDPSFSIPPETVTPPVNVFVPLSVKVPLPLLVTLPVPLMADAITEVPVDALIVIPPEGATREPFCSWYPLVPMVIELTFIWPLIETEPADPLNTAELPLTHA
jgi:hypothetical protein